MRQPVISASRPSSNPAPNTARRPNPALLGVTFFIVAESMFFVGLLYAWVYLRTTTRDFNPPSASPAPIFLPLINTLIAGVSVLTMIYAVRAIGRDDRRGLIVGLLSTAVLGLLFMGLQSVEFVHLGFSASSNAYGSVFIGLMVFHVARVFFGVAFMVLVLARAYVGHFSSQRRAAVQACAMYWFFICAVWLVVLYVLFLI